MSRLKKVKEKMKFRPHLKRVFPPCKKAHATMELLASYGWVVLSVLIVIGILAYLGIFNLENFFPDRCEVGHPFKCTKHDLTREGDDSILITLRLLNQDQRFVTVTNLNVTSEVLDKGHCHANSRDFNNDGNASQLDKDNLIKPREEQKAFVAGMLNDNPTLKCNFAKKFGLSKNKHEIVVDYYYGDSYEFMHRSRGELLVAKPARHLDTSCNGVNRLINFKCGLLKPEDGD